MSEAADDIVQGLAPLRPPLQVLEQLLVVRQLPLGLLRLLPEVRLLLPELLQLGPDLLRLLLEAEDPIG